MKFSILHPSRSRPEKSFSTIQFWKEQSSGTNDIETIVSIDKSDELGIKYYGAYEKFNHPIHRVRFIENDNRSAVDAINNAAKVATGDIFIVVSDDTSCPNNWDTDILKEVEGKTDWILKTQDGIQDYIITMTLMDRVYYDRFGYIYHPGYSHLFADTYMTCVADINGRKLTSNLLFSHKHYSNSGGKEGPDELHKRNDATWAQGEELFIKLMKEFTPEERSRITDVSMRNWLKNKGVR